MTGQRTARRGRRPADIVIILASPSDIHARAVAAEVSGHFGGRPAILDTKDYPNRWRLTSAIGADRPPAWCVQYDNWIARAEDVAGVWRRRPNPHRIHADITDRKARRFSLNEVAAHFQGWLHGLGDRLINPLAAEYAAIRKPFQLLKAREAGLRIPETLITSSAAEVRQFADRLDGKVIFKVLMGVSGAFTETRRLTRAHRRHLTAITYAPAIFQELIEADRDIRATIVDDAVFPVAIRARHPRARLDWRMDLAADIEQHRLPKRVERALIDLLRKLGLRYGAIDLRLTPAGEYVFLEVNPGGQFLFCEIHGKQPISRAFAAALLGRPLKSH